MEKQQRRFKAAVLRYDPDEYAAPRVVAKGAGIIAEKIVQTAREHHIPVYQDQRIVEALLQTDVGSEIPPQLYQAVAEILVFVAQLDQEWAERGPNCHAPNR